jgi:uncharacterized protein YraI
MRLARFFSQVGLLLVATQAAGQALSQRDTLAYTTTIVTVRSNAFDNSAALGRLDAAVPVRLYDCAASWCRIANGKLAGYVHAEYLSSQPTPPLQRPGRSYTNSRGERVASPVRTADSTVPEGASARCRDGTYSFSRSRRGTCSHHGGVAEWLH